MKKINSTICGTEVELVLVTKDMKPRTVHRELGLGIGDHYSYIEIDALYPELAQALKDAGVNLDDLKAVFELVPSANMELGYH